MQTTGRSLIAAAALLPLISMPQSAAARATRSHRHVARGALPTPPSQDAVELATLAPPSTLATIEQTYGDAVYARRRLEGRIDKEAQTDLDTAAAYGGVPYPCDPRYAGTSAYVCNGAPHPRSYGQGYAFTPAYLSAPQRLAVPPDEQSQILPPFTGLSWVVNSLRPDPHN